MTTQNEIPTKKLPTTPTNNPGSVTISGANKLGQQLTALVEDGNGKPNTINYLWLRDGNVIPNATQSTYTLTADDVEKKISVKVSYTDLKGNAENVTSNPTEVIETGTTTDTKTDTTTGGSGTNNTTVENEIKTDGAGTWVPPKPTPPPQVTKIDEATPSLIAVSPKLVTANTPGFVTTDFGFTELAKSVAIQADGKIVVTGSSNGDFALARYNSNGSLDVSFDNDGKVTTDFAGSTDIAEKVLIQKDGKIVVVGSNTNGANVLIARYNTDGKLDPTFGLNGKVTGEGGGYDATLQSDGKILVSGRNAGDFFVTRYNSDGSLDKSFSNSGMGLANNGFVKTDFGLGEDAATGVIEQSDSKIVLAGYSRFSSAAEPNDSARTYLFSLARYYNDGNLDVTFGTQGKVATSIGTTASQSEAVLAQKDGKILVVGASDKNIAIARYNPNGSLDTSFDTNGIVTTALGSKYNYANAVTLQSDGKILVAAEISNGSTTTAATGSDFALIRYNSDGSLDTTFGKSGIATYDLGSLTGKPSFDQAYSLTVQSDNKILLVGGNGKDFALIRVNSDGSLDSTFTGGPSNLPPPVVNNKPTGDVTISGTPTQGQTLTVLNTLADANGLGTISYQWLSNGTVISGANQSNYALTADDIGKTISVKASYMDGKGNAENVTSKSTDLVVGIPVPMPKPTPDQPPQPQPTSTLELSIINVARAANEMNLNGYDQSRPLHGVPYTSVTFKIDGALFKLPLDLKSVDTYVDLYSAINKAIPRLVSSHPEIMDISLNRVVNGRNFTSIDGQSRTADKIILSIPGHVLESSSSSGWEVGLKQAGEPDNSYFSAYINQGSYSSVSLPKDEPNSNEKVIDVIEIADVTLDYSLSISNTEIDEGSEDTITFTVTASDVSDVDVKIPFTLSGSAGSNKDYQGSLTQTSFFTIPAGETSSELSFTANVDWFVEDDELVILTLGELENQGSILEGNGSETAVIHDVFRGKNTSEKWTGTDKNDKAFGNGGNDVLSAGLGDDIVDGGDGNDKITGGQGSDIVAGAAGKDTFIFKKGDSNSEIDFADSILDLEKGERIDLSSISKTFNFIKTIALDLEGSNLKLSSSKFDVYVANLDGDNYLVYETVKDGSSYEIVAVGSEIPDVSSWVLKSGIFTV